MKRNFFLKAAILVLAMSFFNIENGSAQQESAQTELQVQSFELADETDDDTRKPSNFDGNGLKKTALVKIFMPGEIESTDPKAAKIERRQVRGHGYANYVWVPEHSNVLRIVPKDSKFQSVKIDFMDWGISKYTIKNKGGGLQAGKVYHLTLFDPSPVYVDTHLGGTYGTIDNGTAKYYSDKDGRITLRNLSPGTHNIKVYASNGTYRGTASVNDETRNKIITIDARNKARIVLKTNPAGGIIYIVDGESKEKYNPNKEYAYASYKVIANINGKDYTKEITVGAGKNEWTIDKTNSYTVTPMYDGKTVKGSFSIFEDGKILKSTDEGVSFRGASVQLTRPIGQSHTYYATFNSSKSKEKTVTVSENMEDIELRVKSRSDFQLPWNRVYNPVPLGITAGYVEKQIVSTGQGEKLKTNGVWPDGQDKWLHGFQLGIDFQPCWKFGLGMYTGLFWEMYISSGKDDNDDMSFMEHDLYVPVHLMYRIPFSRKVALWVHGGLGFNFGLYGKYSFDSEDGYSADDIDYFDEAVMQTSDGTSIYGPKSFNMAAEVSVNLRLNHVVIGATYSKGLNDNKVYRDFDGVKSHTNKMSLSIAYVFGTSTK